MCKLHNNNLEHKVGNMTIKALPNTNYGGSSGYATPQNGNYGNGMGYAKGAKSYTPVMIFAVSPQYAGKNNIHYGGK